MSVTATNAANVQNARTVRFLEQLPAQTVGKTCTICLEAFSHNTVAIGHGEGESSHIFHRDCMNELVNSGVRQRPIPCPTCRGRIENAPTFEKDAVDLHAQENAPVAVNGDLEEGGVIEVNQGSLAQAVRDTELARQRTRLKICAVVGIMSLGVFICTALTSGMRWAP
jgi:hypothetical protein